MRPTQFSSRPLSFFPSAFLPSLQVQLLNKRHQVMETLVTSRFVVRPYNGAEAISGTFRVPGPEEVRDPVQVVVGPAIDANGVGMARALDD